MNPQSYFLTDLTQMSDDTPPPFNVFDHTISIITLAYIPSFVAFTNAISTTVNYNQPPPPSNVIFMNGQNATFVLHFYSLPQVEYAWLSFAALFLLGTVIAGLVLAGHASYWEWPAHHPSHHHLMHRKIQSAEEKEREGQRKKFDSEIEDDYSTV